PGEREDLMASARHLDQLMREIRDSGKVIGLDRIAVMAALNMAHELLELRREREGLSERIGARVRALQAKVEEALGESSQMEL
ncbi:MAG TPA: cell division protein ZapA, partial [Chromatiales bacterium]|nr:cell division protein ZapA [Chromatiales bacterium]